MTRVLVIDDCQDFGEVVQDLLEDAGYEVVVVRDPEEGKKEFEKQAFGIVLCDLVMPVEPEEEYSQEEGSAMVGVSAIHDFSHAFPNVPVIAVSGQIDEYSMKALKSFGAADSLAKPFEKNELLSVIEEALASDVSMMV